MSWRRTGRPTHGELTLQCIAVAAIMGAVYPYMVLKLGFGPNVSIVLAFSIMFVGAAIRATWLARHPASAARYMIAVASGFIAGEALVAVIAPLLIALGIGLASR